MAQNMNMTLYGRRRTVNSIMLAISLVCAAIGIAALIWILWTLLYNGFTSLNLQVFTESTPGPGQEGGLLNAIYGSFVMTVVATLIGTPIGIMAGTYMNEYAAGSKLTEVVRFINDILLSAPSIIIGVFIYQIMVTNTPYSLGIGFSAGAGSAALALIVIPVVVRTTEDMLRLVPVPLREAASALGAPRWKVIKDVCYRAALTGMVTGVLLAVARISGETAPLLFTAFNNQFWSMDMGQPMANLPNVIYNFTQSPDPNWIELGWAGAILITFAVLALSIAARALSAKRS